MLARFLVAVAAMVVVIAASNILVLYPLNVTLGAVNLADLLTWGAFTFPFAFLITDLTNRYDGPNRARFVVVVGFVVALGLSSLFGLAAVSLYLMSGVIGTLVALRINRALGTPDT